MRLATAAFVVVCSAVCAPSVRAQATVTFNHRAASADPLTDVIAERVFKPGTDFIVNILETCPGAFTYTVRGIGVGGNGATSYMAGPMFRFGDVASIVLGAALTPRLVRPANVTEITVVDNPEIVNTLPRKPRAAVFVGVSFAFLGAQDKFKKPLGIDQPAAGAAPDPNR